jgi:hypothetical protein
LPYDFKREHIFAHPYVDLREPEAPYIRATLLRTGDRVLQDPS